MRRSIPLAAAVFVLPFSYLGCAADTMSEDEALDMAEEAEVTATAEQAITGSQMEGIGRIFDTGASLGFAEFFASIINFSTMTPQVDVNQMNTALNDAAARRSGTFQAIPGYSPPAITTNVTSYQAVANLRSGFHTAVANSSTYGEYFNLGANLAIAEAQASFAQSWNSQPSWQYSCWALDSALYSANLLKTRVKIDVNALSSLRNNVCNNKPAGASGSIKSLREQYATAVYTTAEVVCGNAQCEPGESCLSCSQDCGSCIRCGDGICNGNDTCSNCASDCGSCPCPNNPNGQPNNYNFCVYCPTGYGSVYATTIYQTGCTYQNAFSYVQGTTSSSCLIYNGVCP